MEAICVNADRKLEVRDVPIANNPPPGHLMAEIRGAAIGLGLDLLIQQLESTIKTQSVCDSAQGIEYVYDFLPFPATFQGSPKAFRLPASASAVQR